MHTSAPIILCFQSAPHTRNITAIIPKIMPKTPKAIIAAQFIVVYLVSLVYAYIIAYLE
jgi:hypothetical protein